MEELSFGIPHLQRNTVNKLDIHEACPSPAKTRQRHAHPLKMEVKKKKHQYIILEIKRSDDS